MQYVHIATSIEGVTLSKWTYEWVGDTSDNSTMAGESLWQFGREGLVSRVKLYWVGWDDVTMVTGLPGITVMTATLHLVSCTLLDEG